MAGNCTLFVDHQNYCVVLSAVKQTVASLQLLGSLFIISIIWLFRTYKYFHQRLILALSSAAFVGSIGFMLTDIPPLEGKLCSLQAWMITYFALSILSWVCCITFTIWKAMNGDRARRFEKFYHMISWGVPLVVATLPLAINIYGPAGPWCWIADDSDNTAAWRFGTYYIPLFVCIIGLFIAYTYIFVTHRRQAKQWVGIHARNNPAELEQRKLRMNFVNSLMAYPCIYLVMSLAPFIYRLHNAFSTERNFALMLLHVISIPLTGLINAIAFGFNKETLNRLNWRQIKAAFKQHFPFRNAQMDSSMGEHRLGELTRNETILGEHPCAGEPCNGRLQPPNHHTNHATFNELVTQ